MTKKLSFALGVALSVGACGSSSPHMQPQEPVMAINPLPDQAVVVFMRPSNYGGQVMFSVVDGQHRFLGDLNGRQYFVTVFPPGRYSFIAHAENNDLMHAELTAGRIYYVLVAVRMGMWSARTSISALTPRREEWVNLQEWMAGSTQMRSDMAAAQAAMNPQEIAEWVLDAQVQFANHDEREQGLRMMGATDGVGPGPQVQAPPQPQPAAPVAQPPPADPNAPPPARDPAPTADQTPPPE